MVSDPGSWPHAAPAPLPPLWKLEGAHGRRIMRVDNPCFPLVPARPRTELTRSSQGGRSGTPSRSAIAPLARAAVGAPAGRRQPEEPGGFFFSEPRWRDEGQCAVFSFYLFSSSSNQRVLICAQGVRGQEVLTRFGTESFRSMLWGSCIPPSPNLIPSSCQTLICCWPRLDRT